jgi:hypothetical protein
LKEFLSDVDLQVSLSEPVIYGIVLLRAVRWCDTLSIRFSNAEAVIHAPGGGCSFKSDEVGAGRHLE